jgi:hypothetical protein
MFNTIGREILLRDVRVLLAVVAVGAALGLSASLTGQTGSRVLEREFLDNPDKIGDAKDHFVIVIECCIA